MYSIAQYGRMINDRVRMKACEQALRQTVKPGSVVLDIGTGTGIFALLACQLGARKVYAIEPDSVIQVAREIAVANGYANRITFVQALSTRVDLPERADVVISDLRDVLPLFGQHIPAIADARERLLAPGGVLIPQLDTIWVAVVTADDLYHMGSTPWEENVYGLDMRAARRFVVNRWVQARISPEQMLCEPQVWATLDYTAITEPNVSGTVTFRANHEGTGHGLGVWFDTQLVAGVMLSNSPTEPELVYGMAFFPWEKPVEIDAGDEIVITLEAHLVENDYVWQWQTQVRGQVDGAPLKADFRQSTFLDTPLSSTSLRRRAESFVPSLSIDGLIDHSILDIMGQKKPLGEIAQELMQQYPGHFGGWKDAFSRVAALSEKYCE